MFNDQINRPHEIYYCLHSNRIQPFSVRKKEKKGMKESCQGQGKKMIEMFSETFPFPKNSETKHLRK